MNGAFDDVAEPRHDAHRQSGALGLHYQPTNHSPGRRRNGDDDLVGALAPCELGHVGGGSEYGGAIDLAAVQRSVIVEIADDFPMEILRAHELMCDLTSSLSCSDDENPALHRSTANTRWARRPSCST